MIYIFSDGGSRGNPGKAASSFLIFKDGKLYTKDSQYLGIKTNNFAEYIGVLLALNAFVKSDLDKSEEILFKMDSELVVKQLQGIYKIKNVELQKLALEVKDIIKVNNLKINFQHVPRRENSLADKLVNEKLDDSSRL